MKVQLDKIEKILMNLVDPTAQIEVIKLFSSYKENPLPTYVQGISTIHWYLNNEPEQLGPAIACVIAGIMMADMSTKEEFQKKVFDDAIEYLQRHRGENVVSFMEAKIDKR